MIQKILSWALQIRKKVSVGHVSIITFLGYDRDRVNIISHDLSSVDQQRKLTFYANTMKYIEK